MRQKNILKSVPTCSKILILLSLLTISFCGVIVTFAMAAFFSVGVGNCKERKREHSSVIITRYVFYSSAILFVFGYQLIFR